MTLIFYGHNFRYEIEAVAKLFVPVRAFEFMTADGPEGVGEPFCFLSRKEEGGAAELYVCAKIGGAFAERRGSVNPSADYEHECELSLCRMMYECLSTLTGIRPEWGVLTGVRPVKLVSRLLSRGMNEEELCGYMARELFVSPEKTRLALEAAKNQREIISAQPKNSVSLYVSIPFCPSRCAYCSFVSQTVESFFKLIPEYVLRLCEEIEITASAVRELGLSLDTVYFGGGTPTAIDAGQLDVIMKKISDCFDLSALREYTVEAGRPDTVTKEKINVIRSNGGDRVSVNPQTLSQSVLDAVGRRHTVGQFFEAYALAEKAGFKAINVDLIAGLPTDSCDGFCRSLSGVIALKPQNITVHALSVKRAADLMRSGGALSGAGEAAKMISHAEKGLAAEGYRPYYLYRQKNQLGNQENVGFETGGTAGIYNINMMEEIQTVLAVGAGASTKIVANERDIRRYYNPKYPLEYIKRFDETVAARKKEAAVRLREVVEGE